MPSNNNGDIEFVFYFEKPSPDRYLKICLLKK
jgi:hypothetical protein